MAYRNGTYVAFHAAGTSDPTASDMKYYRLLNAWNVRPDRDFHFIDSHNKAAAVRDTSSKERLKVVLSQRLRNSKNMILILGQTTRFDRDWIPFEIAYAVDNCRIPIIAAYPGFDASGAGPCLNLALCPCLTNPKRRSPRYSRPLSEIPTLGRREPIHP